MQSASEDAPAAPVKVADPIMFIDDLLDDEDLAPLSIGASDPVDPWARRGLDDAFITPAAGTAPGQTANYFHARSHSPRNGWMQKAVRRPACWQG